jgi:hypothetical protein
MMARDGQGPAAAAHANANLQADSKEFFPAAIMVRASTSARK